MSARLLESPTMICESELLDSTSEDSEEASSPDDD